jgi:hypothetical protein
MNQPLFIVARLAAWGFTMICSDSGMIARSGKRYSKNAAFSLVFLAFFRIIAVTEEMRGHTDGESAYAHESEYQSCRP